MMPFALTPQALVQRSERDLNQVVQSSGLSSAARSMERRRCSILRAHLQCRSIAVALYGQIVR